MTDFNTDHLKPYADLARSFAARELAGEVTVHDRYPFGEFYEHVVRKAFEAGFFAAALPEEAGGADFGIDALCEILFHICEIDASPGGIIFTQALAQEILLAAGARDLAGSLLSQAASAQDALLAFPAYTNPAQAGVLPLAIKTGNQYQLSGKIGLLVLGSLARHAVIPARLNGGPDYDFFLVRLDDPLVKTGAPVFTLGFHACPAVDTTFDNVRAELIGAEARGQSFFQNVLPRMNAAAAAMNAGLLRGTYREALAYAQKREQGGRPIIQWSEVGMMLASISIKADVAAMCVRQSCRETVEQSPGYESRVAAAALHVAQLACGATADGIQILGGYGYMKDYGQEKRYRDARMVQALLGSVPFKKLDILYNTAGADQSVSFCNSTENQSI